jgi:cell division protein FtsZ
MSKSFNDVLLQPVIVVCGVGGAGNNAVNNMIESGLEGAKFVAANTDAQALSKSLSPIKIQLGSGITKGLGAGSIPSVGANAADESRDELKKNLENANMVFITAGMGGGTGTGAAPVIAKIAKEMGVLTIGVVTKPFDFEGAYRMQMAMKGIAELSQYVDTLIVIPNQNLFRLSSERTTFLEAFKMSDDVLSGGIKSITDLMNMPGLINLDFADIRTIMAAMGTAVVGTGEASSEEDRSIIAAKAAISNPLLDHSSIKGAQNVLINITGGMDMTLHEVDNAANHIREAVANDEANIIFGSTFDANLEGTIRVSIIATGIESAQHERKQNAPVKEVESLRKSTTNQSRGFSLQNSSRSYTHHNTEERGKFSPQEVAHSSKNVDYENLDVKSVENKKIKIGSLSQESSHYGQHAPNLSEFDNYESPAFFRKNKKFKRDSDSSLLDD